MPATRLQLHADRRADTVRHDLADQLVRLADDAGVNPVQLARAAGVARSHVVRVMAGDASASFEVYQRLGAVLGADLSVRYFPNTGPTVRDRFAAPMLEHILAARHRRWDPFTEVGVRRPSRGWIDLVLHEPRERVLLASELQSELRRLEQLVRWHAAKADSLPSWERYAQLGDEPRISRLLIVRRTRATRAVAAEYGRQLRVAYPAHPDDAISALTGTAAWPGDALVWMMVEPGRMRLVAGR